MGYEIMEPAVFVLMLFSCIGLYVVASAILRVSKNLDQLNQRLDTYFSQSTFNAKDPANRPKD